MTFLIKYLTIIDTTYGRFKIVQYNSKQKYNIANLVKKYCVCRYIMQETIMHDGGNELLGNLLTNCFIKNSTELSLSTQLWQICRQNTYWNEFNES